MIIYSLFLDSRGFIAENQIEVNDFSDINHLEYFVEFFPEEGGYSTTKYALDLRETYISGNSIFRINVKYETPDLTEAGKNFNYQIEQDTHKIIKTNVNFYKNYIPGTHSELLLDLENFGDPQIFRVDETVIFADLFKEGAFKDINKLDLSFYYIGTEVYNRNLTLDYQTYHYQAQHLWDTSGIY
ncbi:MAG: hypothetical protein ACFFD5_15170 [Candidatus Thorarchaeota archaeon]